MGIEESLGKRPKMPHWSLDWEIGIRSAWSPVMDMQTAHEQLFDPYWESQEYSGVWIIMSQLARGILQRAQDWSDEGKANEYILEDLGRSHGKTLLGEALPLPKRFRRHWPYKDLFPIREEYEEAILPERIELWKSLITQHRPRWVICYGRLWFHNRNAFFEQDGQGLNTNRVLTEVLNQSTQIYLMPFFKSDMCKEEDIAAVITSALEVPG